MRIRAILSCTGGLRNAAAQVAEMDEGRLKLVPLPEAYGIGSPSQMEYLAALTGTVEIGSAILPILTRTPTFLAIAAAGFRPFEGRFHLGLGSSRPQVIEGWREEGFDAPLGWTRDVVEICNDLVRQYGDEEEAEEMQDRFLGGKNNEAKVLAVDELLKAMWLFGPKCFVAKRIAASKDSGVNHFHVVSIATGDQDLVDVIAKDEELIGSYAQRSPDSIVGNEFLRCALDGVEGQK